MPPMTLQLQPFRSLSLGKDALLEDPHHNTMTHVCVILGVGLLGLSGLQMMAYHPVNALMQEQISVVAPEFLTYINCRDENVFELLHLRSFITQK